MTVTLDVRLLGTEKGSSNRRFELKKWVWFHYFGPILNLVPRLGPLMNKLKVGSMDSLSGHQILLIKYAPGCEVQSLRKVKALLKDQARL